jgi:hypothetical protein
MSFNNSPKPEKLGYIKTAANLAVNRIVARNAISGDVSIKNATDSVAYPQNQSCQWTGKLWANGECTVGMVAPRKKQKVSQSEKNYNRDWYQHHKVSINTNPTSPDYGSRKIETLALNEDGQTFEQTYSDRQNNPGVTRSPKGKKGITGLGSRMVRNGCHLLESHYGKERLVMLTPTLPQKTPYFHYWILGWSEIVRRFIQELQRELRRQKAPDHIIGVTELHPQSSERLGFGVPHLHLVLVNWDGKTRDKDGKKVYYISTDKFRELWQRTLKNVAISLEIYNENNEDIPLPRVHSQTIKKSAEAYLGKYLSKGKESIKKLESKGVKEICVSHWWHCTKGLRNIIKSSIRAVPVTVINAILAKTDIVKDGMAYFIREIKKEFNRVNPQDEVTPKPSQDKESKVIGYYLKLKPMFSKLPKSELIQLFNTA